MVEARYWYPSPAGLSGMSTPAALYSGTDLDSSISRMTWNRGRIANTAPTIVPSETSLQRPVRPLCELPTPHSYRTVRHDDY
jgi:hypothetical protein